MGQHRVEVVGKGRVNRQAEIGDSLDRHRVRVDGVGGNKVYALLVEVGLSLEGS